ncbi:MAG: hypothetical protein GF317_09990 [Candidatus Lokiarchaeota archaeon]|nr:hypothetical protein [Candidatus Lokiarchaeota archaeon]MBD3200006.1 hypothetical protein [Candidatus Lokiarchaeota archaeon]
MTYLNTPKNYDVSDLHLICDDCGGDQIIETPQGYVCKMCGIELEVPKMEYHRPYGDNKLQHAPLGRTQIGYHFERMRNPLSKRLNTLSRLQNIKDNEKVMANITKNLISKLSSHLDLPRSLFQIYFKKYLEIRKKLSKGTKYRSPEKLVPIVIYYSTKFRNIPINASDLLEITDIEKKDFDSFRLQLIHFWPEYLERNRKKYILKRVMEVAEKYKLGMKFYSLSHRLLEKLWEGIKCTKDDVVAGLISSIVILCNYKDTVPVNQICTTLNIRMSTIQSQVRRKIFERFQIPGFQTLVKSSEILHKLLESLDILNMENSSSNNKKQIQISSNTNYNNKKEDNRNISKIKIRDKLKISLELIEINLSNVKYIQNALNNNDTYKFALFNKKYRKNKTCHLLILRINQKIKKSRPKLEHQRYNSFFFLKDSKGPPQITI